MSLNIRGRCWQDGGEYIAEIPSINVSGKGQSMNDCLTSVKTNLENLSGKTIEIQFSEGNCFLASSQEPSFKDFLENTIQKKMMKV
ncbi:MAG TPA: hypothetical protein VNJ08_14765 [Bacteriovoracaceae bacterium]|nr:hypothetical protein [Bacteriovoracaceae bacterium]